MAFMNTFSPYYQRRLITKRKLYAINVSASLEFLSVNVTCAGQQVCQLVSDVILQMCPCNFSSWDQHQSIHLLSSIMLMQYSSLVLLFSLAHCCEAMSPWHESSEILHSPCRSICRLTCGSHGTLNGDGLTAERLPLSNYMTASRERELRLHDPFMVPNITFLFILNLFVQSSPFNAHYSLSTHAVGERAELQA